MPAPANPAPDGLTPFETTLGKPRAQWSKADWRMVAKDLAGIPAPAKAKRGRPTKPTKPTKPISNKLIELVGATPANDVALEKTDGRPREVTADVDTYSAVEELRQKWLLVNNTVSYAAIYRYLAEQAKEGRITDSPDAIKQYALSIKARYQRGKKTVQNLSKNNIKKADFQGLLSHWHSR
jgi:hypothetical protein